ncbi:UNKNOWN [Stylonychia lemnae]|uniref:Homeobox domain-containing protein n=1 Tax=Stylonychia lemnae TaxID=5949 RepID=A0A078BF74_STYLE|nr:UNKNOWN [Stylonychia lemnae]|eukprot:CDW91792.1 UNKNOWN [Stylonychia lemnae]
MNYIYLNSGSLTQNQPQYNFNQVQHPYIAIPTSYILYPINQSSVIQSSQQMAISEISKINPTIQLIQNNVTQQHSGAQLSNEIIGTQNQQNNEQKCSNELKSFEDSQIQEKSIQYAMDCNDEKRMLDDQNNNHLSNNLLSSNSTNLNLNSEAVQPTSEEVQKKPLQCLIRFLKIKEKADVKILEESSIKSESTLNLKSEEEEVSEKISVEDQVDQLCSEQKRFYKNIIISKRQLDQIREYEKRFPNRCLKHLNKELMKAGESIKGKTIYWIYKKGLSRSQWISTKINQQQSCVTCKKAWYYKYQMNVLKNEYQKNPHWSKGKITELAAKLNMKESQIYKWRWDSKEKFQAQIQTRASDILLPDRIFEIEKIDKDQRDSRKKYIYPKQSVYFKVQHSNKDKFPKIKHSQ